MLYGVRVAYLGRNSWPVVICVLGVYAFRRLQMVVHSLLCDIVSIMCSQYHI